MAKRKKYKFFKIIWIVIVIIGVLVLLSLYLNNKKSQSPPNNQALVSYIPNFNNLTLNDLPNLTDFRDIHDYNGNVIVIGLNRIIEYNKENNKFTRVNDPRILGCVYDSTKIGNSLFVSCNSHFPDNKFLPEATTIIASKLFKIDLNTGKIVKQYFGKELLIDSSIDTNSDSVFKTKGARSNLMLGSKDDILYMASWDGVEKMDTETEKITLYSGPGEIKPGNELSGTGLGLPEWFNKSPIETPEFKFISPLRNDKYYILSSDGLYTLVDGQFPIKTIASKIEAFDISKSTFSEDGQYLVYVGPTLEQNQGQILSYGVNVYLVDINKQILTDLSREIKRVSNPKTGSLSDQISDKINNGYFEENDGVISFKDVDNNILFSIELTNPNLEIMTK